jgi:PAS domain S-box-containing protein
LNSTHNLPDTAELKARRLLERYEALSTAPGVVVWVIDAGLRPVSANAAWERYTGQVHADYGGRGWMNAVHPDDRARLEREITAAFTARKAFVTDLRIRRADGHYRRNVIRAVPVLDAGEIVEWIGTATDVEDARQAADDLAAFEARMRIAHAAAGVGTWEWQFDDNTVRWSSEIFELLGLEPSSAPDPDVWMEHLHPDDSAAAQGNWAAALERAETHFTDSFRMIRADGSVRWILSSAVIFRLPSGDPVRAVGLNIDITAQRTLQAQMEAALAESRDLRARLLALTEEAEALLASRDEPRARAGVIELARRVLPADAYAIWWHDAATGLWRVVEAGGLSERFTSAVLPGAPFPSVQPLIQDDVLADETLGWRHQDYKEEGIYSLFTIPLPIRGERRATLVTYHRTPHVTSETEVRVALALGQVAAAALGNAEFNAAQDRAQLKAQRQAARMAYLAEASVVLGSLEYESTLQQIARMAVPSIADWCAVDLVDEYNGLQRIVTAHLDPEKIALAEALERRYPTDPAALTGVPNVLRTGQPEFYPHISDEMLAAGAADAEHLRILRALDLHSMLIAPLSARGRTLGAITFVGSGEGRELSHDDATVLTEVARRAALAIDNARLFREAETANRLKDEFLAVLSHELRTPLNAIMGWTHMLRQGLPPESQVHAFEVISRNAQSQKQLVEDLLDVARIAAGRVDLDRKPFDLRETAAAAVDSAVPSADEKGIRLELSCPAVPVLVDADPHRIQQVAANLLGNALKFTERGGEVVVGVRLGDEGFAELVVRDSGVGIPREFLPYIFDRFRQADTSLTRAYPGLGLGLWVVKQIVEAHEGSVRADSEGPGTGATLRVRLPSL